MVVCNSFYRAMLCIRRTSHGPVSVCPSVCLSVRLKSGVLLKRLNIGSHKQHHIIVQDFSFLMPKISAKFDRGHPLRGRQMQVGWVKIGDFRQITGCISKTVQDTWFLLESCTRMGITVFPRNRGYSAVMGTEFTVTLRGWGVGDQLHGSTAGTGTKFTVILWERGDLLR